MTLTTAQPSLTTNQGMWLQTQDEGSVLRELLGDATSISLLVRSSVANVTFSVSLFDATAGWSLAKLATCGAANTWTLIQLPNIPVWAPGGTFNLNPGTLGYYLQIVLAAGAGYISSANDVWVSPANYAAIGQSNFAANAVGSTFDIAFVQHEPGSLCTQFIDKPFSQNLDECLRYYQKSYDYDVATGTTTSVGNVSLPQQATTIFVSSVRFHKPMAKIPTMVGYSPTNAINSIRMNGVDYGITSFGNTGKAGFAQVNTATLPAVIAGNTGLMHYIADTGW